MGIISFASLKGGVGKTTLSLNVAGAFAERGCQTLLVDLDPTAHASRFFSNSRTNGFSLVESPIARLFLRAEPTIPGREPDSLIERAVASSIELVVQVREELSILPAGPELRHFLWGKGARIFRQQFSRLVDELCSHYDHIVIDTPPDYNVLTRNAIAVSDQVVVPVDSSAMSIDCLEDIVSSSAHIQGPTWCVARTMVNRQASRIQKLSQDRLSEKMELHDASVGTNRGQNFLADEEQETDEIAEVWASESQSYRESMPSYQLPAHDDEQFMSVLRSRHVANSPAVDPIVPKRNIEAVVKSAEGQVDTSPIFLLNSLIYRTELQNKLTFLGQTAFDTKGTKKLAAEYSAIARELEGLLALEHPDEPDIEFGSLFRGNLNDRDEEDDDGEKQREQCYS